MSKKKHKKQKHNVRTCVNCWINRHVGKNIPCPAFVPITTVPQGHITYINDYMFNSLMYDGPGPRGKELI
jgi:hypothetical protein